jgi:hypothetical protein
LAKLDRVQRSAIGCSKSTSLNSRAAIRLATVSVTFRRTVEVQRLEHSVDVKSDAALL